MPLTEAVDSSEIAFRIADPRIKQKPTAWLLPRGVSPSDEEVTHSFSTRMGLFHRPEQGKDERDGEGAV